MEDHTEEKKNQYGSFWNNKEVFYKFDDDKGYIQSVKTRNSLCRND